MDLKSDIEMTDPLVWKNISFPVKIGRLSSGVSS